MRLTVAASTDMQISCSPVLSRAQTSSASPGSSDTSPVPSRCSANAVDHPVQRLLIDRQRNQPRPRHAEQRRHLRHQRLRAPTAAQSPPHRPPPEPRQFALAQQHQRRLPGRRDQQRPARRAAAPPAAAPHRSPAPPAAAATSPDRLAGIAASPSRNHPIRPRQQFAPIDTAAAPHPDRPPGSPRRHKPAASCHRTR